MFRPMETTVVRGERFATVLARAGIGSGRTQGEIAEGANGPGLEALPPGSPSGTWLKMTVYEAEAGNTLPNEATVKRYAGALGMEAVLVLVPRGTRQVTVHIAEPGEVPEDIARPRRHAGRRPGAEPAVKPIGPKRRPGRPRKVEVAP